MHKESGNKSAVIESAESTPLLNRGAGSIARQLSSLDDRAVGISERVNSHEATLQIALLTGGDDRPYVFGLTKALEEAGVGVDLIGSDDLDFAEFRQSLRVRFLNLRGSMAANVSFANKFGRIFRYYVRLIRYALIAEPKIFHILWNNKFEYFDRTLLMLWYRLCGRRVVFTAHNVNRRKRDKKDSFLNRATLRAQYRQCSAADNVP